MNKILDFYRLQETDSLYLFWLKEVLVAAVIFVIFWGLSRLLRYLLVSWGPRFTAFTKTDLDDRILLRAQVGDLLPVLLAEDPDLVPEVLVHPVHVVLLDGLGALVLLAPAAREDLHIHHDARDAGRAAQRGVPVLGGLLAEDGAEELLLGGELGLALGRDLPDQDVARLHMGPMRMMPLSSRSFR